MSDFSYFFETDLGSLKLDGGDDEIHCAKRYRCDKLAKLSKKLVHKEFGINNELLNDRFIRSIMALAIGSSETELKRAISEGHPISRNNLMAKFCKYVDKKPGDPQRISSQQMFCIIIDFLANRERSASANYKSTVQKHRVKKLISQFADERLKKTEIKEIMLKEFKDKRRSRPDGILKNPNGTVILWYLRYGSGSGGSQGDRRSTFTSLPLKFQYYKFVFIWDGAEVIDTFTQKFNKDLSSQAYITRTRDFDEQRLRELYDSESVEQA